MTVYLLGSLVYLGYVVVFPFVPNLSIVLLSYIFFSSWPNYFRNLAKCLPAGEVESSTAQQSLFENRSLESGFDRDCCICQWYAYQERSAGHYDLFGIQSSSHYTRLGNNAYD